MLVKIMLAKIFEKNLELSSCWFSAWNVHMWSLLQLSSQHMFLPLRHFPPVETLLLQQSSYVANL